jgi:hypothetical protein
VDAGPSSVSLPPRPRHREPRKRWPREFLQNVGVAEGISSGDPSEARQRETAVVQTLGDTLLGDDEEEYCNS